ncbi:MAG: hypothetical protein ABJG47_13525 [Ekhidna sp.]
MRIDKCNHWRLILTFFLTIFFLSGSVSGQVTKTWNASSNSNWNNAASWSPSGVPASSDVVIFDNTSDFNCLIDANVTVDSLSVESTYDGIITQNTGVTLQFNTGANFEGGTFVGGNQNITVQESFTLNGTNFTSTSATLNFLEGADNTSHDIRFTSGAFNHNNGLVRFSLTRGPTAIHGNFTFYDLLLNGRYRSIEMVNDVLVANDMTIHNGSGSITLDLHDTLTVQGKLAYTGTSSLSIDIDNGDAGIGALKFEGATIDLLSNSDGGGGSASLYISGSAPQTINASNVSGRCPLPDIKIECNTLNVSGYITLNSAKWEYISGTLNHPNPFEIVMNGSSEISGSAHTIDSLTINGNFNTQRLAAPITLDGALNIIPANKTTIEVEAPFTLNNDMNINTSAEVVFNLSANQKSTINGSLSTSGIDNLQINGDTLAVSGDISIAHSGTNSGGSGVLELNGTSQLITIDPSLSEGEGELTDLYINMTGTLDFANDGTFNLAGSWQYEQGTLDLSGVTIAVNATSNSSNHALIAGNPHTLNSLCFFGTYGYLDITANISLDGDLKIQSNATEGPAILTLSDQVSIAGDLVTAGANNITIDGDTILVSGDIDIGHTGVGNGTGAIEIIGIGDQLFSGGDVLSTGSVPDIIINKASGTLTLEKYITVNGDWTLDDGVVDTRTNGSSLAIVSADGERKLDLSSPDGIMTLDTLIVDVDSNDQLQIADDLAIRGDLIINEGSAINVESNNVTLGGDWINNNLTNNGFVSSGSTVTLNGTLRQVISCTACTEGEVFLDLVINNTAGSGSDDIFFADTVQITNSLTLTNGVIQTDTDALLYLRDGSTTTIGTGNSHINGRVSYEKASAGSTTLNFPVGKSGNHRPFELTVNHSTATSYTYTAEVFNTSAAALGYTLPTSIANVSYLRYWDIDRSVTGGADSPSTDLAGNASITLYYGTSDEVNDYENLIIAKYDGSSQWENLGGVASGNGSGTIVSQSTPAAFASFGGEITVGNDEDGANSLPVDLIKYSGGIENDNPVIRWETSSELNNSHFSIGRSSDGHSFTNVGKVIGNGTVNKNQYYKWEDFSTNQPVNFYKLSQVDFDGSIEVLGIVRIDVLSHFNDLKIMFDKTKKHFSILGLSQAENVEWIKAYALNGKLIQQLDDELNFSEIQGSIVYLVIHTNLRQNTFKVLMHKTSYSLVSQIHTRTASATTVVGSGKINGTKKPELHKEFRLLKSG